MRGKFITLEGCEGVGKSTQLSFLKAYLTETQQDFLYTREPGGTQIAEEVRKIVLSGVNSVSPLVEAYLFAAARVDHIQNVILPALEQGKSVICDRYIDSSVAYQGYGRGLGKKLVLSINDFAVKNCMPDCTVFINMNPLNSWRKQKGKQILNDRLEEESAVFHTKVYEGYLEMCKQDCGRFVSIVPDFDKQVTHNLIIEALKSRGLIK